MGEASAPVMALRPVAFRYKQAEPDSPDRYGLIAEIAPDIVVYDAEGRPYSARCHLLAPMLLNEMQKQQRTIEELKEVNMLLLQRVGKLEQGAETLAKVQNFPKSD